MRGTARCFGEWLDANVYKVGYLIGTRGQVCTQALIDRSWNIYATYRTMIERHAKKWLANGFVNGAWVVADCMGVLEMYWNGGNYNRPLSSPFKYPDVSTGTIWALVQSSGIPHGTIDSIPRDCPYPLAVCYTGHVGFFYKGVVYQSAGHAYGLVKTNLGSTDINKAWTHWYVIPYLDYQGWTVEGDMLQRGDKGAAVRAWQMRLLQWNANALPRFKADSDFGAETEDWTNRFKTAVKLPADGKVDDLTWDAMVEVLSGKPSAEMEEQLADALAAKTAAEQVASLAKSESARLMSDMMAIKNGLAVLSKY